MSQLLAPGRSRRPSSLLAIAALAVMAPAGMATADHTGAERLPINEAGTGTASDDPCLDRDGRCGFVLSGSLDGEPADATFFSVIQDDGAANADRCVRATYAGLFGDGADRSIGHTARGKLCPDGAGGYVFSASFTITGGLGEFDGARGRGDLVTRIGADGSASLTATGHYRLRGNR